MSVEIPGNVCVPCPREGFRNVGVAKHCPGCAHFLGMVQVDANPQAPFAARFRVQCAHPISRRIAAVDL